METTRNTLILLISLLAFSCAQPVDMEMETALLLESNELQRKAHFEGDPLMLVGEMADTVYVVQRGEIRVETKKDLLKRWEPYFKRVKYSKWDDLQEPVIHIAADASQASVSVNKITISTLFDDDTGAVDTTYFAWTSGYRKVNGVWKIYTMASTRVIKP